VIIAANLSCSCNRGYCHLLGGVTSTY